MLKVRLHIGNIIIVLRPELRWKQKGYKKKNVHKTVQEAWGAVLERCLEVKESSNTDDDQNMRLLNYLLRSYD